MGRGKKNRPKYLFIKEMHSYLLMEMQKRCVYVLLLCAFSLFSFHFSHKGRSGNLLKLSI